jgi:hypothetical protein
MIFGFNTDVPAKEGIYHVQTEDRGPKSTVIESIIYVGGKIMGRKRTPYDRDGMSQDRIEEMVRQQHKDLVEAIREGTWVPTGDAMQGAKTAQPHELNGYAIRLLNSRELHNGDSLRFRFNVEEKAGKAPAANVLLDARWVVGGEVVEKQTLHSGADGGAELLLPLPSDHSYGTLLVSAKGNAGKGMAKFHVRGSKG